MSIITETYRVLGMRQDNLVGTGTSDNFAHEIKNMRLNTVGDYTTAAWTTEEGTLEKEVTWQTPTLNDYNGNLNDIILIGQAVINDTWILFGTFASPILYGKDIIIKLWFDGNILKGTVLYNGNLNFDVNHPIETLTYYENERIQKVYWTDGFNQPRVINITNLPAGPTSATLGADTQFDFVREVALNESVSITKQQGGTGQFPACTVKYAITYYTKYGQESNIVYTSELYYPTRGDRGCSPEELSGDIFKIVVDNVDINHQFDYIRLYSIIRTTDDATPIVRIVEDKSIANIDSNTSVTFIDSNTTGEIIDPTILNYIGGRNLVAQTFDQKDNTLFLGNIELKDKSLAEIEKMYTLDWGLNDTRNPNGLFVDTNPKVIQHSDTPNSEFRPVNPSSGNLTEGDRGFIKKSIGIYPWINQLNNTTHSPKVFKYSEVYRFGIQFQNDKGVWSEVHPLVDAPNNIMPFTTILNKNITNFAQFKYVLPGVTKFTLYRNGFKKARLVCCYPTNADRNILAQGVLCPTTQSTKWNKDNSPNVFSSWFYRFGNESSIGKEEVQSIISDDSTFTLNNEVLTFHSPDIEFDESLRTLDWSNIKLKIVGTAKQTGIATKTYLDYSKQAADYAGNKGSGIIDQSTVTVNLTNGITTDISSNYIKWNDLDVYASNYLARSESKYQKYAITYNYPVYPFQRKYLNNYMGNLTIDINKRGTDVDFAVTESSIIMAKIWSTLRTSHNTIYDVSNINLVPIKDCQVFDSQEIVPIKLKTGLIYYGNIDSIAPLCTDLKKASTTVVEYQGLNPDNGPQNVAGINRSIQSNNVCQKYNGGYSVCNSPKRYGDTGGMLLGVSSDPIPMRYKSTPHVVVQTTSALSNPSTDNTLWVAELYREVEEGQRFGGEIGSIGAQNNIYIPCGPSYKLDDDSQDLPMYGTEGDTYYMRYDNLKTYPFADNDINQIVDIFSFMCETRINLDGRYDKNRGLTDNTNITNTNFNYINSSYTQKDNFFSFSSIDELSATLNSFNNQITWTKTKVAGEDTDIWTNITLANTADADGTVGKISKIINVNDNLYLFQEHGIAQIGYNERTALSTENGVPLELANSGKYTGLRYLTKEVGCQNKWSISSSKNGVMFIDDSRRELNILGDGLQSISTANGFDAFMIQNLTNASNEWNPFTFNNFVTYYDKLGKDVYYINNDYCLAWNEESKTFTSFYDYNRVPYMTNLGQHLMMFKDGSFWAARESDKHSHFFGEYKPYWMTIVCDGANASTPGGPQANHARTNAFSLDKVFNNVEYRADVFDRVNSAQRADINLPIFTDIAAWNGYQVYKEFSINSVRKFNIWRAPLPRATYKDASGNLYTNRDRIRNPFCYLKLVNNNPSSVPAGHRAIIHDVVVYYDIK